MRVPPRWPIRAALILGIWVVAASVAVPSGGAADRGRQSLSKDRVALSVMASLPRRSTATTAHSYAQGTALLVRASRLPRPPATLCVGLASMIDRGSLPLNLGRLRATGHASGELHTRIPAGLIGPEPPGPYLVFVGDCARPAPMGEYAHTIISIHR
jgi:hypothetical protein